MKERGHGRPDHKFVGQANSHLKEQGKALSGFPNSQPEHKADDNPESKPLPNVWDTSKRRSRLLSCAIPYTSLEAIYGVAHSSPGLDRGILRRGVITEEEVRERDWYWREQYKMWSTETLERSLYWSEQVYANKTKLAEEALFPHLRDEYKQIAEDFKYEIELKRQELQRRHNHSDS